MCMIALSTSMYMPYVKIKFQETKFWSASCIPLVYTGEFYSATKRNEVLKVLHELIELENIRLSK